MCTFIGGDCEDKGLIWAAAKSLLLFLVGNLGRGCSVGHALSHSSWSLGASSGRAV